MSPSYRTIERRHSALKPCSPSPSLQPNARRCRFAACHHSPDGASMRSAATKPKLCSAPASPSFTTCKLPRSPMLAHRVVPDIAAAASATPLTAVCSRKEWSSYCESALRVQELGGAATARPS
eukprot:3395584-Prymnesium_polylepis.1